MQTRIYPAKLLYSFKRTHTSLWPKRLEKYDRKQLESIIGALMLTIFYVERELITSTRALRETVVK